MKTKWSLLLILMVGMVTLFNNSKKSMISEKTEVTKIIQTFYEAFENEDLNSLSQIMAHDEDMVVFGTDLDDYEIGWEQFKQVHIGQWELMEDIKLSSKALAVFLSETGQVAWFADVTNWSALINQETMIVDNVRITGVLEKREGIWKMVQIHASIPQN